VRGISKEANNKMAKINKCSSCGGDFYHYAGCGIGEHGVLLSPAPTQSEASEPAEGEEASRDLLILELKTEIAVRRFEAEGRPPSGMTEEEREDWYRGVLP
jgi:hypothetical protein